MFDGLQLASPMGMPGVRELVGGALLLIRLFSRPVALVLSGCMAVADFMAHGSQRHLFVPMLKQGEELAIVCCLVFLHLAAAGGGTWRADFQRGKASG